MGRKNLQSRRGKGGKYDRVRYAPTKYHECLSNLGKGSLVYTKSPVAPEKIFFFPIDFSVFWWN